MQRRGANVIEFAITLPFFIALLLGVLDYGWIFATQSALDAVTTLACREGSMVDASVSSPVVMARNELQRRAQPWCGPAGCIYAVQARYAVPDRAIECSIDMPVNALVGFVPTPDRLTSSAIYRLEWQRQGALE